MNETIKNTLNTLKTSDLLKLSMSSPQKTQKEIRAISIKKSNQGFSAEIRYQKHNNIIQLKDDELIKEFLPLHLLKFKQSLIKTKTKEIQILTNKKEQSKIISKNVLSKDPSINRSKNYIIPDGSPCSFLIELGVMQKNGNVKSSQYKKFRQINRFLELVHDSFKNNSKEELNIIDFGCGKSYLTFALYFYFTEYLKVKANITGIDLKQDVIDECNNIAKKINYNNLKFEHGMVEKYQSSQDIDFIVTLHACDTATDEAMAFGIKHNAKAMFFVPCCQHELNKQLNNEASNSILKHGIFRDRLTAIITDSARVNLIEQCGYKASAMEFIDSADTAKNILIRCQKSDLQESKRNKLKKEYKDLKDQWNITPHLEKRLTMLNLLDINL